MLSSDVARIGNWQKRGQLWLPGMRQFQFTPACCCPGCGDCAEEYTLEISNFANDLCICTTLNATYTLGTRTTIGTANVWCRWHYYLASYDCDFWTTGLYFILYIPSDPNDDANSYVAAAHTLYDNPLDVLSGYLWRAIVATDCAVWSAEILPLWRDAQNSCVPPANVLVSAV